MNQFPFETWTTLVLILCLLSRHWWWSVQRNKLHWLSGGIPAGPKDGGNHPDRRDRGQRRGECSRVPQRAQLGKGTHKHIHHNVSPQKYCQLSCYLQIMLSIFTLFLPIFQSKLLVLMFSLFWLPCRGLIILAYSNNHLGLKTKRFNIPGACFTKVELTKGEFNPNPGLPKPPPCSLFC